MNNEHCRWGILGTAGIARKNWQAIRHSGNGRLVAVASRIAERAAEYIAENQAQVPHHPAPRAIAGYEEMIAAKDIDALYIPLPTGLRKDYILAAVAAGKHVLCEKPCGVNAAELREIIDACAAAGVQFMDGVMFMHSDRLPALRRELDGGHAVGEMSLWTMAYEMPTTVRAHMIREAQVPISLSAEMDFAEGTTAAFYCSFEAEHQQSFTIAGTKGHIVMRDFVLPYHSPEVSFEIEQANFAVDVCQFQMQRHSRKVSVEEHSDSHPTSQETKLFQNFGKLVLGGIPDPHWPEIALKTQILVDACLASARSAGQEISVPRFR